jgi:hypothetical protein
VNTIISLWVLLQSTINFQVQAEDGDEDEPEEGVVEEVEEDDEEIPACLVCVWCIAVLEQLAYCSREQMTWHSLL